MHTWEYIVFLLILILAFHFCFVFFWFGWMQYGTTPFKGKNRNATFSSIINNDVLFPSLPSAFIPQHPSYPPPSSKSHHQHQPINTTGQPCNPIDMSSSCKSLIRKLLHKDEEKRLGSRAGASDVKSHAFFKGLNWALLRNMPPPIQPRLKDGMDTSHFREIPDNLSLDLERDELLMVVSSGSADIGGVGMSNGGGAGGGVERNPFENFESGEFYWCQIERWMCGFLTNRLSFSTFLPPLCSMKI
jgi:serine/threonine protein kinase